jgi:hypothetical protein
VAAAQDPHGTQVAPSSRSSFLTGGFCFVFPTIGRFATWRFILGSQGGEAGWLVRSENTQSHAAEPSRFITKWSFHVRSRARTKFSLLLLQALLFWEVISPPFALYGDFAAFGSLSRDSRDSRDYSFYLSAILELQVDLYRRQSLVTSI